MDYRKKKTEEVIADELRNGGAEVLASAPEVDGAESQVGAPEDADKTPASEIVRLEAEKQEWMNVAMRRQADFDNYRKRVERERAEDRQRGASSLMEGLLPVLDAFDRALTPDSNQVHAEYQKGFEGIYKLLWAMLAKHGLERIEATGKPFNPHVHHAIDQVVSDKYSEEMVIEELQGGYLFHGRVLRPAMVRVAVPGPRESLV